MNLRGVVAPLVTQRGEREAIRRSSEFAYDDERRPSPARARKSYRYSDSPQPLAQPDPRETESQSTARHTHAVRVDVVSAACGPSLSAGGRRSGRRTLHFEGFAG